MHSDNEYMVIRANKIENQQSRAGAIAYLDNASKLEARINLFSDGKYADFTMSGVGKVDGNKAIMVSLTFRKNLIVAWWDTLYPDGSWDDHTIYYKTYNEDLTNLKSDGSDVKAIIENKDGVFYLKVINLANDETIFETSLSLDKTNLTGFNGFNLVRFRSRVRDDIANQNGEEAIEKSENIVNNFEANHGPISLEKFKEMLSQKGLTPINYNLSGKTLATEMDDEESSVIYFDNSKVKYFNYKEDDELIDSGEFSYYMENGIYKNDYGDYFAVVEKNGNLIKGIGYDGENSDLWEKEFLVLNGDAVDTNITENNIKNFLSDTNFINITDDEIEGRWVDNSYNDKFIFNNGDFIILDGEDNSVAAQGPYSINDGIIKVNVENSFYFYFLPVEKSDNTLKFYYVVTKNGSLREGGEITLTKE